MDCPGYTRRELLVRTGKAKTVTLITVPTDITDEAFMEAAKAGVNLSVKGISKDSDRSKNITGNGVYGAAATSATANVLGFTIPEPKATETSDPVPEAVKVRRNGKAPETVGTNGVAK